MHNEEQPLTGTEEDIRSLCQESPDLAAETLYKLVSSNEADGSALTRAAYGFHLLGHHDAEIEAIQRLVSTDPSAPDSLRFLGDALMEVGREQEARQAFHDALRACVDLADMSQLARIVASWGLYDMCIEVTRRWSNVESRSVDAYALLGFSLGMTGDHGEAVNAFQVALELEPEERLHRHNLSLALARAGRMLEGWRVFWIEPAEHDQGPIEAMLFENPVVMDWEVAGTDFVRRMRYEAEGRLPLLSSKAGWVETAAEAYAVKFESPALRSKLLIQPTSSGLVFIVESLDSAPVQEPDLVLWRSMVNNCMDVKGGKRAIPWYAIIGTRPVSNFEASDQQLTARSRLADLELYPCPPVREHTGSPALRNELVRSISPIAVEGICHGFHDWGIEAAEEARVTRELCAFLSLMWNSAWETKVAPRTGYADELIEKLDEAVVHTEDNLLIAVDAVRVESWMESALMRLRHDETLQNAVHAFHEAMLLFNKHPSVAATRLVTCCEVLGGRQGSSTSSGSKVRATFDSLVTQDEAEELWEAYRRRNETAHEAKYHGSELSEGLEDDDPLRTNNPELAFTLGLLNRLRIVTRQALLKALGVSGQA